MHANKWKWGPVKSYLKNDANNMQSNYITDIIYVKCRRSNIRVLIKYEVQVCYTFQHNSVDCVRVTGICLVLICHRKLVKYTSWTAYDLKRISFSCLLLQYTHHSIRVVLSLRRLILIARVMFRYLFVFCPSVVS